MVHVFISHSGRDNDFARDLANFLEEGGETTTFVDDHDIRRGEHFVSRIESGMQNEHSGGLPRTTFSDWVKTIVRASPQGQFEIVEFTKMNVA